MTKLVWPVLCDAYGWSFFPCGTATHYIFINKSDNKHNIIYLQEIHCIREYLITVVSVAMFPCSNLVFFLPFIALVACNYLLAVIGAAADK